MIERAKNKLSYRNHCCICGKFCKWDSDYSIDFGGPYDLDPKLPDYYCDECAKKQENHYAIKGWVPNCWQKAKWQIRAANRLGLVEIRLGTCNWTEWYPEWKIPPDGYKQVKTDLRKAYGSK